MRASPSQQQGPRDPTVSKVVLVHGAMDRAKSFLPVVEHLPDLTVIEYDRRGYGESLPAGIPAVLAQHVDDLLGVMDDEPTTVVAHSFGCVVAVSAAIQQPGRFRGLGLWEPQVPWMEFWPTPVRRGLEAMAAEVDTDALAERVYVSMVGEEAWRRLPEELKVRRRAEGVAFQSDVVIGLSPPFRWEDLTVPSLFGVGLATWPFAAGSRDQAGGVPGRGVVHDRGRRPHRSCEPSPGICGVRATQHHAARDVSDPAIAARTRSLQPRRPTCRASRPLRGVHV